MYAHYLTGEQFKKANKKNLDSIVFRMRETFPYVEFQYKDGSVTQLNYEPNFKTTFFPDKVKYDWCMLYAHSYDHEIQFFIESLRNGDHIIFEERDNSNQYVKNANLITVELRARITRYKRDGKTISKQFETTIDNRTVSIDW